MSTAPVAQNGGDRWFRSRGLHIVVAAVGLVRAVSTQGVGVYFQNSYGLVSPSNVVTFSEFSPSPTTMITTQYQAYGVTFLPYVHYASIYNQTSGTPNIDPTACVANFVQYGPVVPTFSIVFKRPVAAAAFSVLSQAGTFQVTALMVGTELSGGGHTFTGGYGPDRTTNFVGFSDGRYAYLATGAKDFEPINQNDDQFLMIVDMKNPRQPKEAGRWWMPGRP